MKLIEASIRGTSALLMHNVRLANPFDPYTKRIVEFTKSKKVKGADKEAVSEDLARAEWEGGLYHTATERSNEGIGPYLPARNLHKAVLEAARMTKEGPSVERGSFLIVQKFGLLYEGPRGVQELYDAGFVDQQVVVVGQARVVRTRPMFAEWAADVSFAVDPEVCDAERFLHFLKQAGLFKGVCDGHKGIFGMGRFKVETSSVSTMST